MKLLLLLALPVLAQNAAQTRQSLLAHAIERWTPMARAETADPALRALAEELAGLKARAAQPQLSGPALEKLQGEYEDWKRRFIRLQFDRRPAGAPQDFGDYSAMLAMNVGALWGGEPAATGKRLDTLKTLVDPAAFAWYVERSPGRTAAAVGGSGPANPGARALKPGDKLPAGWSWSGGKSTVSDLGGPEPPSDPDLQQQVTKLGEFRAKAGGTVGWCYAGVKKVLAKLGVVDSFIGDRGIDPEGKIVGRNEVLGAYQFSRWVENHPTLQKRRLVKLARPAWPVEISDIVVWGRGVCGYHETWGHIEMIYKLSPDKKRAWAVSDHSSEFQVSCFTREAEKLAAAQASLPGLRSVLSEAEQAAAAAAKGPDQKARRAADKALAAAKKPVKQAEAVLERLAVFQIGPEQ